MPYDVTVPKTGSNGASDYTAMRGNYDQIQTSFSIDHKSLGNSGALEGFHKKVTFSAPISDPGQVSPIASAYTKTVGPASQLFFQNGALAANVFQLTGNLVNDGSNATIASQYTVVTPWGITFKFGLTQNIASGTPVNLVSAFATNFLGVLITPRLNNFAQSGANITVNPSQFTPYFSGGGAQTLYFFAWGN